jgi:ABC-type sugar transport system substrate-binding protein
MRTFSIKFGGIACVFVLLAGCGPKKETAAPAADSSSGGKVVGVSLSSRNHNFFLGMEQGVTDELKAQGLTADTMVA